MIKLELYTGTKTYLFSNGAIATREAVLERHPAALTFLHVVTTDELGECFLGFDPLSRLMSLYDVDPSTPPDDALRIIEEINNAVPEPPPPSAEERIAAAMEFQNMMML